MVSFVKICFIIQVHFWSFHLFPNLKPHSKFPTIKILHKVIFHEKKKKEKTKKKPKRKPKTETKQNKPKAKKEKKNLIAVEKRKDGMAKMFKP